MWPRPPACFSSPPSLLLSSLSLSLRRSADVRTLWSGRREEEVNYSSGHQCCKETFFSFFPSCPSLCSICLYHFCLHTELILLPLYLAGGAKAAVQHVGLWDLLHALCTSGQQGHWSGGGAGVRLQQTGRPEVYCVHTTNYHWPFSILVVCWFSPRESYWTTS